MLRTILIGLGALVVVAAVAIGITLYVTRAPDPGAFYEPPGGSEDAAPGTLLRDEPFTAGIPDGATAWRILYSTTGMDGRPVAVSGLVIAGAAARAWPGPRPVLAWAHGTIGVARGCATSLLDDPSVALAKPMDRILEQGWVVVATDYPGLGGPGAHPYLAGEETGRAVIDSVRAARALDTGVELDARYAVWGESQGGHAALWTGQVATAGHAPELTLVGVGAAAPASDLGPMLTAALGTTPGKVLTALAVSSWTTVYPELDFDAAVVRRARAPIRAIARRCLFPGFFVVAAQAGLLPARLLAVDITTDPAWKRRVAENTPTGPIDAPVLLAQGVNDPLVSPAAQARYVAARCAAGEDIDFRRHPRGHVDIMESAGPELVAWTSRLFAGAPVAAGCATAGDRP
ncbi:MAG TPA: lipase family protein [Miltoncostaeaceae bacterium]|nr:lipase family protein [Miltoncostaeaceae bacterium]